MFFWEHDFIPKIITGAFRCHLLMIFCLRNREKWIWALAWVPLTNFSLKPEVDIEDFLFEEIWVNILEVKCLFVFGDDYSA